MTRPVTLPKTLPKTLPSGARILVVALRRLGDVLLTTPLIRSLKQAFPDASIDALVYAGTEGVLTGNPDLKNVMTVPARPKRGDTLALLTRMPSAMTSRCRRRPATGRPCSPRSPGGRAWA